MSRGLDRVIDPLTGDYVDAPNGEYGETPTIKTGAYHQMRGRRNRWWGDKAHGCDLYLVNSRGLDRATVVFAEDAIRRGLQPFVDDGEATDVQVVSQADANGRLTMETGITDIQAGPLDLSDIYPIGEE